MRFSQSIEFFITENRIEMIEKIIKIDKIKRIINFEDTRIKTITLRIDYYVE